MIIELYAMHKRRAEISQAVGVGVWSISAWKSEKRFPTPEHYAALVNYYNQIVAPKDVRVTWVWDNHREEVVLIPGTVFKQGLDASADYLTRYFADRWAGYMRQVRNSKRSLMDLSNDYYAARYDSFRNILHEKVKEAYAIKTARANYP